MGFFDSINLSLKIRQTLRPFLEKKQSQLRIYAPLSEAFPAEIVDIYEKMYLAPMKYREEKELYEKTQKALIAHNEAITLIKEAYDSWNMKRFLEDPRAYGEEKFKKAKAASRAVKLFDDVPASHLKFAEEVGNFSDDYEAICEEFGA